MRYVCPECRKQRATRQALAQHRRKEHGVRTPPRVVKWRVLRVSARTHAMLEHMKAHTDVSMAEFIERVVAHIYGGGIVSMQALTFFVMYIDGKPQFVVAAQDAEKAEIGMRQQQLGQKPFKSIKAVPLLDADEKDLQRVGIAAILSQITQVSTMLQMLLAKQR